MIDAPSSISINIEIELISVNYINAQNVVLPLPDFDNQSQANFPNKTIINDGLFTCGIKAKSIASVSKNLIAKTFLWEQFLKECQQANNKKHYSQQQLLSAIFHKIYRDAKVYLHHEHLTTVIAVPQIIPNSIFTNIVNLAKSVGFSSAQIIYQELALIKEVFSTIQTSQISSILINWDQQSSYIGLFDNKLNQIKYEYISELNQSLLVSGIYEVLIDVYVKKHNKNISQEGHIKLRDISLTIIDAFSNQKENKVTVNNMIDGNHFSFQMNLHHFSLYVFPLIKKLIYSTAHFTSNSPSSNDIHYIVKCDLFHIDFVKDEFCKIISENLSIISENPSLISSGALKSLNNQQDDKLETSNTHIVLPSGIFWGVIGIDSNSGQKIVDTICSSHETNIELPNTFSRQYDLFTDEQGICYLPLGTSNNQEIVTLGTITVQSSDKFNSKLSIEIAFISKNNTDISCDIREIEYQKNLSWAWSQVVNTSTQTLEKMEMF